MKKAAPKAQDADAKPYEPTPIEAKAIEAYRAAKEKRGPRLKMIVTGKDAVTIGPDHPDTLIGTIDLMRAIGTTDREFFKGLVGQLANASKEAEASERGLNFMLAVIKGIQPRDQIEAMLGAQMAAVHMYSSMIRSPDAWRTSTISRSRTAPRPPSTSSPGRSRRRCRP